MDPISHNNLRNLLFEKPKIRDGCPLIPRLTGGAPPKNLRITCADFFRPLRIPSLADEDENRHRRLGRGQRFERPGKFPLVDSRRIQRYD